jgi:hypothetical protein
MVECLGGSLLCGTSIIVKQYVYEVSDVSLATRMSLGGHLLEVAEEWAD